MPATLARGGHSVNSNASRQCLEGQLGAKLNVARIPYARNLTVSSLRNRSLNCAEIRVVENVESLCPKLQGHGFTNPNVLEQREVESSCRRPVDLATAPGIDVIPRDRAGGRIELEAATVEILFERVWRVRIGIAKYVRPIAGNDRGDVAKSGGVIIRT